MQHYTFCDQKVHAHFGKTILYPISHFHFFSFNTLSSSEIYHLSESFLLKYRPFKCNIDHKLKNINHLRQMVDYRPMVDQPMVVYRPMAVFREILKSGSHESPPPGSCLNIHPFSWPQVSITNHRCPFSNCAFYESQK